VSDVVTTLYRPVGRKELELIRAGGFRAFPPRLASQPFFYPVLHEEYALQIARDWNTKDEASGYQGYVLRFNVRTEFLSRYEVHVAGESRHREYWSRTGVGRIQPEHPGKNRGIAGVRYTNVMQ
jgi:hypothetical protein